jgi:peroxiredoxin/outer membrane lipoprotein-sorting protein
MQIEKRIKGWLLTAAAALVLEGWALYVVSASPEHWRPALIVKDEPAARALYEAMVQAMQEAKSLSYTSACSGPDERTSAFKVLLKKPDCFRIEVVNGPSTRYSRLVGEGGYLWIFWSGDRPFLRVDDANSYEKAHSNVYVQKATAAGKDSIENEIARLGIAWYGMILDPSTFHGLVDTLEPYRDGIRSRGKDKVGDEECDVIEVGVMKAQRTRYFWLSRRDHLPRRIKEIIRTASNSITVEEWSDLMVNPEIPPKTFAWSPPQGWKPWSPPEPENSLLKKGQKAPDFELFAARGGKVKLSDYRGKFVWLYVWQVGSPSCRQEMRRLQNLYEKQKDRGVVIIGFNCTDDKRIARAFLHENSVTFPNVLDSSTVAQKMLSEDYKNRTGDVPLSYVIDPQGNIVDAWYGHDESHERATKTLEKLGLRLEGL